MKKILYLFVACVMAAPVFGAKQNCKVSAEQPIKLLSAEMKRSFKTLKKQNPPVYYMAYTYIDSVERFFRAAYGGVAIQQQETWRALDVLVRVGSPTLDNTRTLKQGNNNYSIVLKDMPSLEGDPSAFTAAVWRTTQLAVEQAQQDFGRVQADVLAASKRMDDSPDFAFPVVDSYCRTADPATFDWAKIENMLLEASRLVEGNPFVLHSDFSLTFEGGHRYFVDSRGTRLKTPIIDFRLSYSVEGKTADGLQISRGKFYNIVDANGVPSKEILFADVEQSLKELEALYKAPLAEPITAPAILKNQAMGVFVHEVLGHRMEGHRQKEDSFGRTFTSKLGQQVTVPFISVVDDPTLSSFKEQPLRGFYEYDEEGVKAEPVVMVDNGVLKNFLMSTSPIEGFSRSNGHGRRAWGRRPVARMGNTRVIASETVSYNKLEEMLLEEIKKQGKPYGFIIEDLSGGFTMTDTDSPQVFKLEPKLVYRVYPDGRKEVVRGADLVGTPLVSFAQILAAADDDNVFNGNCGAESGWVPVAAIAPSVLFKTLEIEHTAKSAVKPPMLPPPYEAAKGGKK